MLALKPDEVIITQGEQQFHAKKVLIGLKGGKLSGEGAYQAILHPGLLDTTGEPRKVASTSATSTDGSGQSEQQVNQQYSSL
jgi:stage II sporulation protein GA (sporulation sigma-E factor processing peptidase)